MSHNVMLTYAVKDKLYYLWLSVDVAGGGFEYYMFAA